jgi:predicted peroxiredoxin
MADKEKLVIMVTHGRDDPERATIPFVMGCAALATEVEVVLGLQVEGVRLARRGEVDQISAAGFPPLAKLFTEFQELGGKLLVCNPCLKSREITPEDLVDGSEIVAAARFVAEITSATNCLAY